MKIGLLGDIHANHRALKAVLDSARFENVSKLLITGDFVGYYFEPEKVMRLLSKWEYVAVRGNHEEMLRVAQHDSEKLSKITDKYGGGIEAALEQLNHKETTYLCDLPHPLEIDIDGISILLCHGSPTDLNQYIYPDSDSSILAQYSDSQYDLIVTGHTHYPMRKTLGTTCVVNPGSVGQPRNRIPGAAWAIFDTEERSLSFRREDYDVEELLAECYNRHPELPYLARVLTRT